MIQTNGPKLIVLVVSGLILAGMVNSLCQQNWVLHDGFCFVSPSGKLPWGDALAVCHALNGTLGEPRDLSLDRWLRHYARKKNLGNVWIGASDQFKEGRFEWVGDGSHVTHSSFYLGMPDDHNDEDCVHLASAHGYDWNDLSCSKYLRFLCQKPSV